MKKQPGKKGPHRAGLSLGKGALLLVILAGYSEENGHVLFKRDWPSCRENRLEEGVWGSRTYQGAAALEMEPSALRAGSPQTDRCSALRIWGARGELMVRQGGFT